MRFAGFPSARTSILYGIFGLGLTAELAEAQPKAAQFSKMSAAANKARVAELVHNAFSAIWLDSDLEEADLKAEVRAALDAGASPNARNEHGQTLLLQAIDNQRFSIIEMLLKRGANPNLAILKEDGTRPRDLSPSLKAIYDATSSKGETPLMRTIAMHESLIRPAQRILITRRLLKQGANPNARNQSGKTALMIAALHGQRESVRLLLQRGADFHLRDAQGQSALQIASAPPPRFYVLSPLLNLKNANSEQDRYRILNEQQKRDEAMARQMENQVAQRRASIVKLLKAAGATR